MQYDELSAVSSTVQYLYSALSPFGCQLRELSNYLIALQRGTVGWQGGWLRGTVGWQGGWLRGTVGWQGGWQQADLSAALPANRGAGDEVMLSGYSADHLVIVLR